jgi:hypothetical protein
MRTTQQRSDKRQGWIDHVLDTVRDRYGIAVLREDIEYSIPPVETWDAIG